MNIMRNTECNAVISTTHILYSRWFEIRTGKVDTGERNVTET